jgi:hypothetical protein
MPQETLHSMKITSLLPDEYAAYYNTYLQLVSDEWSLTEELEVSVHNFIRFVQEIPMDKYDYRYAEGKWTIKDIIQHLIDTERIFSYRALRFARNDKTELPGYDENLYAAVALVRQSTIMLYKSFTDEDLLKRGIASQNIASVRALGFIIIGHQNHHIKVFKERYLQI